MGSAPIQFGCRRRALLPSSRSRINRRPGVFDDARRYSIGRLRIGSRYHVVGDEIATILGDVGFGSNPFVDWAIVRLMRESSDAPLGDCAVLVAPLVARPFARSMHLLVGKLDYHTP